MLDRRFIAWICSDLVFPITSGMCEKPHFLISGLWESEGPRGGRGLFTWVSLHIAGSTLTLSKARNHSEWTSEDGGLGSKHLGEVAGPLEVMGSQRWTRAG